MGAMKQWREGDRVVIVTRPVTEDDRKANRYFEHMAGLTGTVQNIYAPDQVAIKVDPKTLTEVTAEVHKVATERMREKFLNNVSDEQRKQLTKEELEFEANFVLLVRGEDLEQVG
jgi:ribosomal protein L21E